MGKSIIFIHGAWVTPLCWDDFKGYFESRGYTCMAPSWPYKDKSVAEQQRNPDPRLAHLGITEIVDHYASIIRAQPEPPFLIGHSFGGLFVQMLLDRGLGAAGVAIDSAPPRGVIPLRYWSVIRSNLRILMTFGGWHKIILPSLSDFQYAFIHLLPENEQRAIYDKFVVPETGRIFFQTALALLNNITTVNFSKGQRAPLLLIAGSADRVCPAPQNRDNYNRYKGSSAVTAYKEFENRVHWIIAQPGWEEVASYIDNWLSKLPAR
jgi:pimeloyl-ACP methyl ester carboxylesterase